MDLDREELVHGGGTPAQSEEDAVQLDQLVGVQGSSGEGEALPASPATSCGLAGDELTQLLRDELRWRYGRHHQRLIDALCIQVAGDMTLITCATFDDMDIVQKEMIGAIQSILVRLEVPPQIAFTTRASWEARSARAGNARSRTASTNGLPSSA